MNLKWINERILITGGTGLVGRALQNALYAIGCRNVISIGSKDCDLRKFSSTLTGFAWSKPQYVFHLAAKVYGIGGNMNYKADSLFDNVSINTNVIECCRRLNIKKVVAMGSGCVYPDNEGYNLSEDNIWDGKPHASEDSYAHAKRLMLAQLIANQEQYGLKYAYGISGNLYGKYDKFDIENGHVVPALIAKFYNAYRNKTPVVVWGTGIAKRDFTYGDDIARALIYLMDKGEGAINMGSGFIHCIKDIVDILQNITRVQVEWDQTKPDGQKERHYNLTRLKQLGFYPEINLSRGLQITYDWYVSNNGRG